MHTSVLDKIHQEIISNVGDVFILYHFVLIDMLDFKNSIWWLIHFRTLSYGMSIVGLAVNISQ